MALRQNGGVSSMGRLFPVRRMFVAVSWGALLAVGNVQAGQILVTNTNNSLAGSLRQAIQDANPGGGDTIVFQIPTNDPGYDATTGVWAHLLTRRDLLIPSSPAPGG